MPSAIAKGGRKSTTANNPENALDFIIERMLKGRVNTAAPVRVDGVQPGGTGQAGFVTITPLVAQLDADGNSLAPQPIHNVPYSRLQGGVAAVIVDPVPGDIGWAVFCQRDISSVKANRGAANPGSYRTFDQADAIYLGGILQKKPLIWLELTQEGVATLRAPQKVVLDTPLVQVLGRIEQTGQQGQGSTFTGGLTNSGGKVTSNNIVLEDHLHEDVQPGDGTTGKPK